MEHRSVTFWMVTFAPVLTPLTVMSAPRLEIVESWRHNRLVGFDGDWPCWVGAGPSA